MLKILLGIIGIVLLLPIAITVVAAIVVTLIGGYVWIVFEIAGWVIVAALIIVGLVALLKRIF